MDWIQAAGIARGARRGVGNILEKIEERKRDQEQQERREQLDSFFEDAKRLNYEEVTKTTPEGITEVWGRTEFGDEILKKRKIKLDDGSAMEIKFPEPEGKKKLDITSTSKRKLEYYSTLTQEQFEGIVGQEFDDKEQFLMWAGETFGMDSLRTPELQKMTEWYSEPTEEVDIERFDIKHPISTFRNIGKETIRPREEYWGKEAIPQPTKPTLPPTPATPEAIPRAIPVETGVQYQGISEDDLYRKVQGGDENARLEAIRRGYLKK